MFSGIFQFHVTCQEDCQSDRETHNQESADVERLLIKQILKLWHQSRDMFHDLMFSVSLRQRHYAVATLLLHSETLKLLNRLRHACL